MENTNSQSVDHTQELPKALQLGGLKISVGDRELLSYTNHTIAPGKITVIVGGSGAGKSVLLRTLAGLIPRNGPAIKWEGTIQSVHAQDTVHQPRKHERSELERRISPETVVTGQPRIESSFSNSPYSTN